MRLLTDIAGRLVRIVLAVLIGGVLVFFGLTRTQVGRDELRREVEQRFSEQFQGDLQIRELKGNLVNDLFASDVRLYDPAGNLVLSVDSAVIQPRWRNLFRRTVSVGEVTLYRPEIHFIREADGTWSFPKSFLRRIPTAGTSAPWSFHSADLRIIDGSVRTSNRGGLPAAVADGQVFNYASTHVRHLDAAITVDWQPDVKLINVLHASADWPDQRLAIDLLQGQLVLDGENLAVHELALRAGETMVNGTASIESFRLLGTDSLGQAGIALDLRPSHIDHDDLRRFFPGLPLADAVDVEGHVEGPVSALTIEHIRLGRGQSVIEAEGMLRGLPGEAAFDVTLSPSTLFAHDLLAVLPDAGVPDFRHLGRVAVTGTAEGLLPLSAPEGTPAGHLASTFTVQAAAGTVSGTLDAKDLGSAAPRYTARLGVKQLDVGAVVQRAALYSRLNGVLRVQGRGMSRDSLQGRVQLNLSPSVFAGRAVDTLSTVFSVDGQVADGGGFVTQGGGVVQARGTLDLRSGTPAYQLEVAARRVDAGPLLLSDALWTDLNADVRLTGSGFTADDLIGQLAISFDSSSVQMGTQRRHVPPHQTTLTLASAASSEPRLVLTGDAATVRLDGEVLLDPLVALSRLWGTALAESLQRELDKPLSGGTPAPGLTYINTADSTSATSVRQQGFRELARRHLLRAGLADGVGFTADVQIHRPDILAALIPALPVLETNLQARFDVRAGADQLSVTGSMTADSLDVRRTRADGLTATLNLEANLNAPLQQTLRVALDTEADSFTVSTLAFVSPSLSFRFGRRAGQLSLTTQGSEQAGPLQLTAALDLLPDRNRLTLFNLRFSTGAYEWVNADDQPIDLYSDAVVIPGLKLESRSPGSEHVQQLHIHGTLSPSPRHVLYADISDLSLRQLTRLTRLKKPVHGLIRGRLALAGGLRRPELTGTLEVPVLTYGNNLLGQLEATSRFVPGSPDVVLDVTLEPVASAEEAANLLINGERPSGALTPHENAIHLGGTFRLPDVRGGRAAGHPGAFDLTLDVDRAELFFMQDIFPEVIADAHGFAEGRGTISGSFRRPVFDAQLQVRDGTFRIPEFNLAYTAEGPVRIDAEGIHLDGAVVTDGSGGTAALTGAIRFNDYEYFSFDLGGRLDGLRIMNVMQSDELPFYGRIWASGDATLTGPIYEATLRSDNAQTSPESEVFIPLTETGVTVDPGFIVFADSTGKIPDLKRLVRRKNVLARRPVGERMFLDGLDMDLNIFAPQGTTVHLVIDPLLGDVINAVGTGRIQLQRSEGEFFTYGSLDVTSGDYLFTAGDVFFRRFLIDEGTITYDGDPTDALLDITASYRTRASSAGLPQLGAGNTLIPMIVRLNITGRLSTPAVNLNLAVDRRDREVVGNYEGLEATLNQPEKATEYATSVLLTNSFLLTTSSIESSDYARTNTNQFAFNSLSQLVGSQINRYLNQAIPNLDLNVGVAAGERTQDLDVTYGVALRLLDERLVIRGQGVYQNDETDHPNRGEFVVEVRLSPNVAVEVFYRRESDILSDAALTNTTGAGLSYQTQFSTWRRLVDRLFGWMRPGDGEASAPDTAAGAS